jgi:hypothetical protein
MFLKQNDNLVHGTPRRIYLFVLGRFKKENGI